MAAARQSKASAMILLAALAACAPAGEGATAPPPKAERAAAAERLAAELLESADANKDGKLQSHEFIAAVQKHSGADHPAASGLGSTTWGSTFRIADADADGRLDRGELVHAISVLLLEHAADTSSLSDLNLVGLSGFLAGAPREDSHSAAMLRRLRSRAAPQKSVVRRLDESTDGKVDDARCRAPMGYPSRPEGFVCLNETANIYCTGGKRWGEERSCQWKGRCKAGSLEDGGCEYPLCDGRKVDGSYCHNNTVFHCVKAQSHGHSETQSVRLKACPGQTCQERFRRTKLCINTKIFDFEFCIPEPGKLSTYADCESTSHFV